MYSFKIKKEQAAKVSISEEYIKNFPLHLAKKDLIHGLINSLSEEDLDKFFDIKIVDPKSEESLQIMLNRNLHDKHLVEIIEDPLNFGRILIFAKLTHYSNE